MSIPPYKAKSDDSPWDAVEHHQSKERAMNDASGEKVILVVKLGYDQATETPAVMWAWRRQFLQFLQDHDPDGQFRNTLADELVEMAGHVRNGDIFRD